MRMFLTFLLLAAAILFFRAPGWMAPPLFPVAASAVGTTLAHALPAPPPEAGPLAPQLQDAMACAGLVAELRDYCTGHVDAGSSTFARICEANAAIAFCNCMDRQCVGEVQ
jgi:hypothetical protein